MLGSTALDTELQHRQLNESSNKKSQSYNEVYIWMLDCCFRKKQKLLGKVITQSIHIKIKANSKNTYWKVMSCKTNSSALLSETMRLTWTFKIQSYKMLIQYCLAEKPMEEHVCVSSNYCKQENQHKKKSSWFWLAEELENWWWEDVTHWKISTVFQNLWIALWGAKVQICRGWILSCANWSSSFIICFSSRFTLLFVYTSGVQSVAFKKTSTTDHQ